MNGTVRALRRLATPAATPKPAPGELCEMCTEPIADFHAHVVDLEHRNLMCTCRPCGLLFTNEGAAGGRYRTVPDRYRTFPSVALSDAQWESLQIPVGVAFFFHNSEIDRIAAFYPGPAGATESQLSLDAWGELVAAYPQLADLASDVEAVIVRRSGSEGECFLVPIDACYELVGMLRQVWRGFDGGQEAHDALDGFFAKVRSRAG